MGRKLFEGLMKKTVYGQFAGGEDDVAVKEKMRHLEQQGIKTMLSYAMESDDLASHQDAKTK